TRGGNDKRLKLRCGNTVDRSECPRFVLQHGLGDVIAVACASLVRVRWAHAVAALIKDAAAQQRGRALQAAAPRHRLGGKLGLHGLEQRGIENGLVLAAVNLTSVDHLATPKRPPPTVRPFDSRRGLLRMPRRSRSSANSRTEPSSRYRAKIVRTAAASAGTTTIFLSTAA